MSSFLNTRKLLKNNGLYVPFHKIRFIDSTSVFGHSVVVKVFHDGTVCISFKGKQYNFEKAFGLKFHIGAFQLFAHENGIVLFSGHKFKYFVFENDLITKVEFRQCQSSIYKCFFLGKINLIVLCAGKSIMSFIFQDNKFTMRHYQIRHGIDGGILTLIKQTPYFVCCIHPTNSELRLLSIDLNTGQQNTVLKMGNNDHFCSFKHNNQKLFVITKSRTSPNRENEVDPQIIHETRESWRQEGGIIWENLLENVLKEHRYKIIYENVLKELMEKTDKNS